MKDQASPPKSHGFLSFAPLVALLFALACVNSPLLASDYYPPRVSQLDGTAAYEPAGEVDWEDLTINLPLLSGDRIFSHLDSKVEVDFGQANFARLGPETDVSFSGLGDKESSLELHSGSLILRINRDYRFKIYAPDGLISVKKEGLYRIDVSENRPTEVVVRKGRADIESAAGRARAETGEQMALAAGPGGKLEVTYGYYEDSLDRWSDRRDAAFVSSASVRYVGGTYYPGVWDLDYYGSWSYYPGYGQVWMPRVSMGWVPFRHGRWIYAGPYGYTWVSYDPWGWLPYHYGTWMYWGSRWCWLPGGFNAWTAAPVNFYFGGGYVGWAPRGFYGRGRGGGTTIINNNTVIVNNNGPTAGPGRRGMTIVRQGDFRYGRSVHEINSPDVGHSNVSWRSGLPSDASNSFRQGRQSVARGDRFVSASPLRNGLPADRRVETATRAGSTAGRRSTESRQSVATQRAGRGSERMNSAAPAGRSAASAAAPAASRDRARTSVSGGREAAGDVRSYSIGNRASSPAAPTPRQNQERTVERARSQSRSVPAPVAPSPRAEPPSGRSYVAPSRSEAPRIDSRPTAQGTERPMSRSYAAPSVSRAVPSASRPSAIRSVPSVSRPSAARSTFSRPSVSRPSYSSPSSSRPSFSRPSASRPSFSRPAVSRPSASRPAASRPSNSSSRPSGNNGRPHRN